MDSGSGGEEPGIGGGVFQRPAGAEWIDEGKHSSFIEFCVLRAFGEVEMGRMCAAAWEMLQGEKHRGKETLGWISNSSPNLPVDQFEDLEEYETM